MGRPWRLGRTGVARRRSTCAASRRTRHRARRRAGAAGGASVHPIAGCGVDDCCRTPRPLRRGPDRAPALRHRATPWPACTPPGPGPDRLRRARPALAQLRLTDDVAVPVHERFILRAVSPDGDLGRRRHRGRRPPATPAERRRRPGARSQTLSGGRRGRGKVRARSLLEAREAGPGRRPGWPWTWALSSPQVGMRPWSGLAAWSKSAALVLSTRTCLTTWDTEGVGGRASVPCRPPDAARDAARGAAPPPAAPSIARCLCSGASWKKRSVQQALLAAEEGTGPRGRVLARRRMLSPVERAIAEEIEAAVPARRPASPPNLRDVIWARTGGAAIFITFSASRESLGGDDWITDQQPPS